MYHVKLTQEVTMARGTLSKAGAIVGLFIGASVVIPSCTIHIGPGSGEKGGQTPTDPSDGKGGAGGQGGLSPEEEALLTLQGADPQQLAIQQLKAEYASYFVKSMVEANIVDPSTVDSATVNSLMGQYAPIAWDEAEKWISALDPSLLPLATVTPKYDCQKKYGWCDGTNTCTFPGQPAAYCVLTGCGEGRCGPCPSLFDIDKLVVKHWCSYTCMVNKQIVGMKTVWFIALNYEWDECWPFEKPIPCEGVCGP